MEATPLLQVVELSTELPLLFAEALDLGPPDHQPGLPLGDLQRRPQPLDQVQAAHRDRHAAARHKVGGPATAAEIPNTSV